MSTRYLVCVVKDGRFRIAQYGQSDGYPSGAGVEVLNFLREVDLGKFRAQVDNCRFGTEVPFNRNTGAAILDVVMHATTTKPLLLKDCSEDRMICEWVYVIDLDRDALEIRSGYYLQAAIFPLRELPDEETFLGSLGAKTAAK